LQAAVDLTNDKKRAAEPVPKAVSKGTTNMNMGGGPRSLTTHIPAPSSTSDNIEASEWGEFQKFKAMRASGQCQSVAAPAPSPLSALPQQVSSMDSNLLMQSMMNPMSSLMSNPMAMNPMASMMGMMNPMASMTMNPMASMMGMMNPMASMVNPVQMAFSMGMQMAQQNGNQNGNRVNVEGEKPFDPNNRVL